MPEGRLYIGNRRYSSWSMRGWLAVKLANLDVEEVLIHFSRPGPTDAIGKLSPNGLVPYLEHRGARLGIACDLRILRGDRTIALAVRSHCPRTCPFDQRG